MFDLDFGVFAMKTVLGLILEIVEINENNMYMEIDLIKQDMMILLQIAMVGSKIGYFKTVMSMIYLVWCLVISVFGIKYLSILYHKLFFLI